MAKSNKAQTVLFQSNGSKELSFGEPTNFQNPAPTPAETETSLEINEVEEINELQPQQEQTDVREAPKNIKRERLKMLSRKVESLKDKMGWNTINEGLIYLYAEAGFTDLKTFAQWKKEGKRVIKGSEALYLWAKPLKAQEEAEEEINSSKFKNYFPICYVFSREQVK